MWKSAVLVAALPTQGGAKVETARASPGRKRHSERWPRGSRQRRTNHTAFRKLYYACWDAEIRTAEAG